MPSKESSNESVSADRSQGPANSDNEKGDKGPKPSVEIELSEEDQALKDGLELAVNRLQESDTSLHEQALQYLCNEIRTSTASMTSVPKPLKMLRPFYDDLKKVYQSWHVAHDMKQTMADMLSVLAMTMAEPGSHECLKFKLEGTSVEISSWGHEYVRSLSGEISEEYNRRLVEATSGVDPDMDDLMCLVDDIIPFQMHHNAEAEAVDLLLEVQQLSKLIEADVVDERNYERVCLYLLRCADYMPDPDDLSELFNTAYTIYKQQNKHTDALRVAIKMDDMYKIEDLFHDESEASDLVKKQMAFVLARSRYNFECDDEELNELIGNARLHEYFQSVARDLDVIEPKTPEDIYKTHLAEGHPNPRSRNTSSAPVDSARANLASSFVNAFVNAGHCTDKLMTTENSQWVYKNKDHGMTSAAASLGMLLLWNVDGGLNEIDKFFHNREDYIKAGACLAIGIVSSGVRNDADPALALLSEYLDSTSSSIKCAAICGLGIAYASARRMEIQELLIPIVAATEDCNITEVSLAALSLGMVFVGTCDDEIAGVIVQRLMEASDDELNHTTARFLCLGLGLLYLGKNERCEATIEAVRTVEHKMGKYADITLETCAYAGTGNVLMIQRMLHVCAEHQSENSDHQAVAVIGIALMTVGEDIGTEMSLRTFDHLLHYGGITVKRVVPLALALLYVSNPDYSVIDQLSRLSHDGDAHVAQSAIFSLGLVSAGSNNSRVAGLLRQLSEFYAKEANHLFIVRLAQGLNAMGKGLLTLSPFHSDRLLMNGSSVAGILTILHACVDIQGTLLDKFHYILFFLTPSMNPRFMATLNGQLELNKCTVRVGQAVETVGQAGRPRTITGFQTHTTPVLLGYKDRAEMASTDRRPVAAVMEGFVITEVVEESMEEV
eukprot:CAMPEP_0185030934 /NCGR_PEP_ID=MMETSP1103-20130426/18094_1 /TAXON_ID=36769 /ORGANISM="Paraphysomonas bandaiensis, Strain Caron Lab Isolate" /LENGTH=894 /DNA_ID=CAMNT_0027566249 /DNA_START=45 /DNA_END=2729 /DNA_ORIENTATION=-